MTLSTSVTNRNALKTATVYLIISIIVALFGAVYEKYGHGVYSYFMIYAFAVPLVGGCLPFALLSLGVTAKYPSEITRAIYHSGISTLTVGSIIKGVLDIYGTTNALLIVFLIVGALLIIAGIIKYLVEPQKE